MLSVLSVGFANDWLCCISRLMSGCIRGKILFVDNSVAPCSSNNGLQFELKDLKAELCCYGTISGVAISCVWPKDPSVSVWCWSTLQFGRKSMVRKMGIDLAQPSNAGGAERVCRVCSAALMHLQPNTQCKMMRWSSAVRWK